MGASAATSLSRSEPGSSNPEDGFEVSSSASESQPVNSLPQGVTDANQAQMKTLISPILINTLPFDPSDFLISLDQKTSPSVYAFISVLRSLFFSASPKTLPRPKLATLHNTETKA